MTPAKKPRQIMPSRLHFCGPWRSTTAMSYAFSAALTVIFSAIVNVMAHVKMKGIDMIESLKSAE